MNRFIAILHLDILPKQIMYLKKIFWTDMGQKRWLSLYYEKPDTLKKEY